MYLSIFPFLDNIFLIYAEYILSNVYKFESSMCLRDLILLLLRIIIPYS